MLAALHDALATYEPTGCCSAVCAHLTTDTTPMALQIASAGHPPGLIRHATGEVDQLDGHGTLLDLSTGCQLSESHATLAAGDLVLFATHGVGHARRNGQRFGTDRIAATLRHAAPTTAQAVVDHLHTTVDGWENRQHDDRATLAIRIPS